MYYVINIFKLTYLRYLLSDLAQICWSKKQICDLHLYFNIIRDTLCIINLVFNKMEETFQSNTLDWSSLVIFLLSKHLRPPNTLSFFIEILSNVAVI